MKCARHLLICAVLAAPAEAAVFTVTRTDDPLPDGCARDDCSLREAVLAANAWPGRDTVQLRAATHHLTRIDPANDAAGGERGALGVTESLIVDGAGAAATRVRWSSPYRFHHQVFRTDDSAPTGVSLTLRELAVSGGRGGRGGCIHMENLSGKPHQLSLEAVRVEHCVAYGYGGAAYLHDTRLTLLDTQLDDNRATRVGGALHLQGPIAVDSRNSSLRRNHADEHGGAVRIWGAGTVGIYSDVVWVDDGRSVIADNTAGGDGGAFMIENTATLDLSTSAAAPAGQLLLVENNVALGRGGGLRYSTGQGLVGIGSTNRLRRVRLLGNQAVAGGGVHTSVSLQASDTEIAHNVATGGNGGGIAFAGTVEWSGGRTVQRVSLHDNRAPAAGGGAIASECASFQATDVSIHRNLAASGRGQGIETIGAAQLRHATLFGNDHLSAPGSPGLYKLYGSSCGDTSLSFANSLIADHCASTVATQLASEGGNQLGMNAGACPSLPAADEFQPGVDPFGLASGSYGGDFEVMGWPDDGNARPQRDFGLAAYCSATDVRGWPRVDGFCDAGAFEQP